MRFYWPIAKLDHEQRMVWGYASTEAEDEQGEIIRREALAAALADYMRFANIREMHQPSAVGIAEEAAIDERGLYLGARIVDAEAWDKVVAGVYKGFSIGGRVTARDPADRKVITGLSLTEISVVDRPANPEAVFDCWKHAPEPPDAVGRTKPADTGGDVAADRASLVRPTPVEVKSAAASPHPSPPPQAGEGGERSERVGAGQAQATASARLRALLAKLCEVVDELAPEDDELAALAIADSLRKARRSQSDSVAAGLAKLADDIMPRLDALQRRVDDIATTPLPPLTASRGLSAIAKRDDATGTFATPPDYPNADIVTALARMTEEERTLTLIKAAYATPVRPIMR
jgi:phage head maturation protease